jgi:hypothetical protein
MNPVIIARFESYQQLLIECAAISHFEIIKQRAVADRGHIRIRATLIDGGLLELSEFLLCDDNSLIQDAYTFHWQNSEGQLIRRWDNARHHRELPHVPHHIHQADGTVRGNPKIPTLSSVLDTIERQIAPWAN